jgi:hypothetical protein
MKLLRETFTERMLLNCSELDLFYLSAVRSGGSFHGMTMWHPVPRMMGSGLRIPTSGIEIA